MTEAQHIFRASALIGSTTGCGKSRLDGGKADGKAHRFPSLASCGASQGAYGKVASPSRQRSLCPRRPLACARKLASLASENMESIGIIIYIGGKKNHVEVPLAPTGSHPSERLPEHFQLVLIISGVRN